jgi:hypothetical protein
LARRGVADGDGRTTKLRMAEVKADNIAAGRNDRSAKRRQLVCCGQRLVTVRDDLQKIARPNDRAVTEIGNLSQALREPRERNA